MATRDERNKFSMAIMEMATDFGISHLEAIVHYSEKNNMEIEIAANLVNDALKSHLEIEGAALNYLPKVSTLPQD